ncbi:zinc finger protein 862-like [Glandiceps talaboti]
MPVSTAARTMVVEMMATNWYRPHILLFAWLVCSVVMDLISGSRSEVQKLVSLRDGEFSGNDTPPTTVSRTEDHDADVGASCQNDGQTTPGTPTIGDDSDGEPIQKKRKQVHCFQNGWLVDKTLCYDESVDLFWLRYDDTTGMYCYLCRKHDTSQQGSYVWSRECSVRYRRNVVSSHGTSEMHLLAKEKECLQRYSQFEQEIQKRKSVEHEVVIAAFKAACWIAREDVAVNKYSSLVGLISSIGDDPLHLHDFGHTNFTSVREMVIIIGDVLSSKLIERIGSHDVALLLDEATDVTVYQQVIMYLRYLHEGDVKTQFYGVEHLTESATGANLADLVQTRLQRDNIGLSQIKFVGSDGAANMTGRFALSIGDTVKSLKWLKRYEGTLQQINKLFEYSPEKTRKLELISTQYESMLSDGKRKKFVRPAAMRWTSHERANDAIYHGYEVLLQTLYYFTEEARIRDATAAGLYSFCRQYMFIGIVYILQTVLPIIGRLARLWQKDILIFSEVKPYTRTAIDKLSELKRTREPLNQLRAEFEGGRFSDGQVQFTHKNEEGLDIFYDKLLTELCSNLEARLSLMPLLEAFELFDPCRFPGVDDKQYGKDDISLLCQQFAIDEEKTQDEWCNFRYKFDSPPMSTLSTAGDVCQVIMKQRNAIEDEYPNLCKLAELALLVPMSNAWPERGASCLKRIKS